MKDRVVNLYPIKSKIITDLFYNNYLKNQYFYTSSLFHCLQKGLVSLFRFNHLCMLLNHHRKKIGDDSESEAINSDKVSKSNYTVLLIFLFLLGIAGAVYLSKERKNEKDFYEISDGQPVLAPWRKEKLQRELEEIDDAVQYALVATAAGRYPCYNCPGSQPTIWLEIGHTWKYGATRKGEVGRYRGQLPDQRLLFVIQFRGTYSDCLKMGKRKIYEYGILPENQARAIPLIRPPGNKNDG